MTDRELLELAAKAAGMVIHEARQAERDASFDPEKVGLFIARGSTWWDPLTDDGDAFRLAVKLNMDLVFDIDLSEVIATDPYAATRRAIVRAAAEIGRQMT